MIHVNMLIIKIGYFFLNEHKLLLLIKSAKLKVHYGQLAVEILEFFPAISSSESTITIRRIARFYDAQ